MSDEKLVAAKGFSANGVTMQAGEEHTDQYDAQTVKQLVTMRRLIPASQYEPAAEPESEPESAPAPAPTGKQNRAVNPGAGEGASAPAGGGLPGVNG